MAKRVVHGFALFFAALVFLLNLKVNLLLDAFLRALLTWLLFFFLARWLIPKCSAFIAGFLGKEQEENVPKGMVIDVRLEDDRAERADMEGANQRDEGLSPDGRQRSKEEDGFETWDLESLRLPK